MNACKHRANEYIKKRLEGTGENFLKVFDFEMDFMYRCNVEC
jgi:predicted nucleic-acid-binding Zn-ribbon protein